ncbi:MAG: hypothetical protein RL172_520 [Bacteroidota bacterium]|jgi:membrane protein required for colicin V production
MVDVFFIIILVIAIIKGLQKGLAVAVFSVIAFIAGLAAAIKLSAVVANYLQKNVAVPGQWLPVLSFALVFIAVVILVNMGGKLVQKSFEMAFLGWANKLGGALFYAILYTFILSVVLFYAEQVQLLKPDAINQSVTYPFIKPWGPVVINNLGKVIPIFKDLFEQLGNFFQGISDKMAH